MPCRTCSSCRFGSREGDCVRESCWSSSRGGSLPDTAPLVTGMEAITAVPEAPALDAPELFANRELSWLQFNERVLELAEDEATPLLERVKFLAIYASNLDEFVMVRVAGLHDQVDAGIDARGPDGLSPSETIDCVAQAVAAQVKRRSYQWEHA